MSNQKRSAENALDLPGALLEGDPTVEWTPSFFGEYGCNNLLYLDKYKYTLRLEKDDGPEEKTIELHSYLRAARWKPGDRRGDDGKCHRYLVKGLLVESENVHFSGSYYRTNQRYEDVPVAVEQEIKEEDDDKVNFVSAKNGKLLDRKTYEAEEKEFEEKEQADKEFFDRVKYWHPHSCASSIIEFRKGFAKRNRRSDTCR